MAWVTRVKRPTGEELVLGFHASHVAAYKQAQEFNRRYQTDSAVAEEFDASSEAWPGTRAAG